MKWTMTDFGHIGQPWYQFGALFKYVHSYLDLLKKNSTAADYENQYTDIQTSAIKCISKDTNHWGKGPY